MTKTMTDREMLQACLEAMQEAERAKAKGTSTRWTDFIAALQTHLSVEDSLPRTREEAEKIIAGWNIECCGRKLHIAGSCSICDNDE